jgi:hypothetical protein
MSRSSQTGFNAGAPRLRARLAAIVTALLLAAAVAGIAAGASAAGKAKVIVTLGSTATMPDPSCPESPCQAIGSVTGFQVSTSQGKLPFRVPHDGKVKFWTLTLAQPTPSQRSFFNGFFGTPPEARLAILRKVPGTNPPRYNLRSQGSIHVLSPYLGQTIKFSANLRVHKGDVVGITVPTWAPAFAQGLPASSSWRASREAGKCVNPTDVRQGEPQQKVGKRATYGCRYTTARLLYTATVVED